MLVINVVLYTCVRLDNMDMIFVVSTVNSFFKPELCLQCSQIIRLMYVTKIIKLNEQKQKNSDTIKPL